MQLYINGERIEVTLEHEKTALDVVMSLTKIFAEEDKIITGVTINGEFYSSDNETLGRIAVEEIEKIELEVTDKQQVVETLLEKSREICVSVAEDLRTNGYAHVAQYREIIEWILEVVEIVQSLSPVEMMENSLIRRTLLDLLQYFQGEEKEEKDIPQLVQVMQSLSHYFEVLASKCVVSGRIDKGELGQALDGLLEILPQIAESFQLGQDRLAFDKIHQVISVLESAVLYLRQNAGNFASREDEIENLAQGLNALLSDIVSAFEKYDVVLLGDLLEYELPEKIETYKALVWES
ncbi:MAG: hypothetical protein N2314_03100 [Brevinematales bacterium]|nr:hypothetical protein [Brevinematales bacterium]